jgi:hypothetical protein
MLRLTTRTTGTSIKAPRGAGHWPAIFRSRRPPALKGLRFSPASSNRQWRLPSVIGCMTLRGALVGRSASAGPTVQGVITARMFLGRADRDHRDNYGYQHHGRGCGGGVLRRHARRRLLMSGKGWEFPPRSSRSLARPSYATGAGGRFLDRTAEPYVRPPGGDPKRVMAPARP